MTYRPHRAAGRRDHRCAGSALMAACLILVATACGPTVIQGRAASMLYDPDRVGGLRADGGFTGVRPRRARQPQGSVEGTDGGDDDRLALLAVNDIEEFWTARLPAVFRRRVPPGRRRSRSYDAQQSTPAGRVCGTTVTYSDPNAAYCRRDDSISWDRRRADP